MDFGKTLKSKRESKDLTLQQIARELKININVLKNIELSEANELPNSTSTKGFLRSYATHLGIDSKPLVDDYMSKIKSARKPVEETVLKRTIEPKPFFLSEFIQKKVLPVIILAVFVGLGFVAFKYLNGADKLAADSITLNKGLKKPAKANSKAKQVKDLAKESAVSDSSNEQVDEADSAIESISTAKKVVTDALKKKHKLIIEPLDQTYAYYKSDKDKSFVTLSLKPNTRRTFAFNSAEIKFLDAGAISLILDGKDLGSPGIFAEEKTIKFPSLEGL